MQFKFDFDIKHTLNFLFLSYIFSRPATFLTCHSIMLALFKNQQIFSWLSYFILLGTLHLLSLHAMRIWYPVRPVTALISGELVMVTRYHVWCF